MIVIIFIKTIIEIEVAKNVFLFFKTFYLLNDKTFFYYKGNTHL